MKINRMTRWMLAGLLGLALTAGGVSAQTAPAADDTKGMVRDLLETIRLQQQSINDLKQRMDSTDKALSELKDLIKQQTDQFKAAQTTLEETRKQIQAAGPAGGEEGYRATDEYGAELQFKNAYSVQRMAMFDPHIKRKDQPPYFRQAIKEFSLVVERYPKTHWAPEALVRIARLHKRLGENAESQAAYARLLQEYSDSEYTEEAQEGAGSSAR